MCVVVSREVDTAGVQKYNSLIDPVLLLTIARKDVCGRSSSGRDFELETHPNPNPSSC